MLKADGFDEAVIGIVEQAGSDSFICYDYDMCVLTLQVDSDMSEEEAIEYMEFNVISAYMGEGTPMFLRKSSLEDIEE